MPINLQGLRDALHSWFVLSSGLPVDKVIWAEQGGERPAVPFATLKIVSGPSRVGGQDDKMMAEGKQKVSISVPAVLPLTTYSVQVNASTFQTVTGATPTLAGLLSALAIAVNGGGEPVTASALPATLEIEANTNGVPFEFSTSANLTWALAAAAFFLRIEGERDLTLSCQVFAATEEEAVGTLEAVVSGMDDPDVNAALDVDGLSIYDDGTIQDLSALLDAGWEGRAQVDVGFYAGSRKDRVDVPNIERATVSGTYLGG